MNLWLFLIALAFLSSFLTWGLIKISGKTRLLDIPNERSFHTKVTPRGGGLAIVATFMFGILVIYYKQVVAVPIFTALIVGGSVLAVVGLIDDKRSISALVRLLVQVLVAVFSIFCLTNIPQLPFQEYFPFLQSFSYVIAIIVIVWSSNLFNFMDGINGLAGMEAFYLSSGAALILYVNGETLHAASLLVLSSSVLGFLFFNFPRARIFMGDVGSVFLGFLIAIYAIGLSSEDIISPWSWVILYGYFLVDSTTTLITRMLTGQSWLAAHKQHAYQKLAMSLNSHAKTTVIIFCINVFWLFPIAYLATAQNDYASICALIGLLPIFVLIIHARAGRPEETKEP